MSTSVYSDKKFFYFIEVWWASVIVLQIFILRQLEVDYFHTIVDASASGILLGFLCFLLSNNMRYYLPRKEKYWYIIISSLVVCFIWLILLLITLYLILPTNDPYIGFFKDSTGIRFGAAFLLTSSLTMFNLLLYSQQEQREMLARQTETEKLSRDAELFKLRQQLQPHFLFNSLNSISSLTGTDPEKARYMVQQLSEFLRGMLRKDEEKKITLEDELQYLRLYLEIEKVRFGHRLQTEISYPQDAENCFLPPLILQPVVENAIKFGLYDTIGDVLIKITAERSGHHLLIRVQNPFDPETGHPVKGTGFGITSIARRLYLLYTRKDLVKTRAVDNEFITEIIIPQT